MANTSRNGSLDELQEMFAKMDLNQKYNFIAQIKKQIDENKTPAKIKLCNEFCRIYTAEKKEFEANNQPTKEKQTTSRVNTNKANANRVNSNKADTNKANANKINNVAGKRENKKTLAYNKAKGFTKEMYTELKNDEKETLGALTAIYKRNKKKVISVCAIVAISIVIYGLSGGLVDLSTPEKASESFIQACITGDFDTASYIFPYETAYDATVYDIHEAFRNMNPYKYKLKKVNGGVMLFNNVEYETYYRISFEGYDNYLEIVLTREGNKYFVYSAKITNDAAKLFDFFG